ASARTATMGRYETEASASSALTPAVATPRVELPVMPLPRVRGHRARRLGRGTAWQESPRSMTRAGTFDRRRCRYRGHDRKARDGWTARTDRRTHRVRGCPAGARTALPPGPG